METMSEDNHYNLKVTVVLNLRLSQIRNISPELLRRFPTSTKLHMIFLRVFVFIFIFRVGSSSLLAVCYGKSNCRRLIVSAEISKQSRLVDRTPMWIKENVVTSLECSRTIQSKFCGIVFGDHATICISLAAVAIFSIASIHSVEFRYQTSKNLRLLIKHKIKCYYSSFVKAQLQAI